MTVTNQTKSVTGNGNGSATLFSFSPMVLPDDSSQIVVTHRDADGVETVLSEGTGASAYAVVVTSYPGTGSIRYPEDEVTPMPSGESITMKRVLTLEQQLNLENQGGYNPDTTELQLDRTIMLLLQQQDGLDRVIKAPDTDISPSMVLPTSTARANRFLAFDANGDVTVGTNPQLEFADGTAAAPSISFGDDPDTGMYRVGADVLGFSVGGNGVFRATSNGFYVDIDGSAANPAIGFNDDPDTGMYRPGADQIGFTVGGSLTFKVASAGVFNIAGSASAPSYSFEADPDTGMYRVGANDIGFAANGAKVGGINPNQFTSPAGSAAVPGQSFISDVDTGMYSNGADSIGFAANGVRQAVIGDGGGDGTDYVTILGGSSVVQIAASGSGNVDMLLSTAGSGVLRFGDHSAIAAETVTGYLTVKDEAGNSRKLAVVS